MKPQYLLETDKDSQHLDAALRVFERKYDIAKLAKKLRIKSPGVLYNRLNPENDTHHMYVDLLADLTKETNDNSLIEALNKDLGLSVHEVPSSNVAEEDIHKLIFERQYQLGDFVRKYSQAMEDEVLTHDEVDELECSLGKTMALLAKTVSSLRAKAKYIPKLKGVA